MKEGEDAVDIPYDKEAIEQYTKRIIDAIVEKVCKAKKGYDSQRPLISTKGI